jgi:hypothetical protein
LEGNLGTADHDIPDYPNYATALAVSAICRARRDGWQAQIAPMIGYLRRQQFTEQNGWNPRDAVYGAWGMGSGRRTPPDTGHVDLSMTRYVLDALHAAGVGDSDPAFAATRIFVERCQNFDPNVSPGADGGFFFSTTEADTNKAGQAGDRFRSYGTTTAEALDSYFKAVELDPMHEWRRSEALRFARSLGTEGKRVSAVALQAVSRFPELFPDDWQTEFVLAGFLALNGDWERARKRLEELAASEIGPRDVWTFLIALQTGHLDDAIALLEHAGADDRWRPLYEALRASQANSKQYLRRVAPEFRTVAEQILSELAPELTD